MTRIGDAVRSYVPAARDRVRGFVGAQSQETESDGTNPLEEYFWNNTGRLLHKWHHYFDIYDRHFSAFRDQRVNVVEFGVQGGGSLQMWKNYFGDRAQITGVDINPKCARLTEERIDVVIGDQEDRGFLRDLGDRLGRIDVLIEDGGHHPGQQIATFETLWPVISDGGVFLIEDLHTSYFANYDGGYKRPGTFIEYSKDLIDQIHAWRSREPEVFGVDDYTRTIGGMHIYESIIVFDKAKVARPRHSRTGGSRAKPDSRPS